MIACHKYINENNINAKSILQIHDELIFEVEESVVDKFMEEVKNIMESVVELSVPLVVNGEKGDNWGQL